MCIYIYILIIYSQTGYGHKYKQCMNVYTVIAHYTPKRQTAANVETPDVLMS